MNKKTLISSLLITLTFLFLNVQKVSAAINYNLFNYTYPVSAYYPKSSDKANVMGRIIKINNVRNDYSVSIPMDVSQNSEGKLNYFGLTTSTNAYFTHDSGNSITNAGSLTGPNTLVGPGLQNPVKLPIPSSTITIDGQTYYFNYYVVQVVTEKVISPINEVQGNNYALQPLDTLPANANFAWAYYSDSPGAIIHYKTEDGTELLTSPTLIGESGDTIPSEVRDFTGYTLVSVPEEDSFKKAQLTNLTYVYRKNPVAATVTVKYIDTQGNSISDYIPLSGNVGQEYTTEQKIISGYTFKEVQGNKSGLFSTTPQTVTYIYTKNPIEIKTGTVTIKYVDTNGNSISDEITKSGNVGSLYTSEQKKILGYNFKEIQGIAEGQFTIESQTVTYVYTKISTPTIIKTSVIPPKTLSVKTLPKESLPETGDKFFGFTLLSGSLLILVSTTLYLLKSKKYK
ncbi:MucBP domain-containing protein [Lactococcus lactis]|uniref:MucBP domain-containing protein n=1 Tax=Lactococcus lactis TaxID=1358 RepID=UPI000A6A0388|nr:MucBP domain-containing protein [Lactococcus lactis]MDM7500587.1 MucBP domain-containing protein [Lactococcus lactis]MDM7513475.1 MucBP domain-containing protein [Lactococcus lactis]